MSNWMLAVTGDFSNMKTVKAEAHKRDFQVQYVSSVNEAFELMAVKDFVLIAVRADSVDYKSKLRVMRDMKTMPIMMFSYTYVSDKEKVEALKMGADVFIATPFALEYLVESGLALIRLYTKLGGLKSLKPGSILAHDHIILSTQARSVYVHGEEVILSKREFNLLRLFMKEPGRVFTYEQIYKRIVGYDDVDNLQKVIYNHTYQLRRKLKISPEIPDYIISVKDVGYKLSQCFE